MQANTPIQNWYARQDSRTHALLIGLTIGVVGGLLGLLLALAGPLITVGVVIGGLAGLYILTDVNAALYGLIAVLALVPFGSMPFKIVLTPTLLDAVVGAFILVYLLQWMTGQRHKLQLTPVHALILIYALWLVLSFLLGLRFASPTPNKMRQFAETLMAISLTFILIDVVRNPATLRRIITVFIVLMAMQALITVVLYITPDNLAERILVRLARIGYPNGGVIRYIEDNPALAERAIGTWVDPNLLGGTLVISASIAAPQVFSQRPVLRWRWLAGLVFLLISAALFLSFSRASMLALGSGLFFIGVVRYRRYLPLLFLASLSLLVLPQMQIYVERFIEAFTGADLATQMRIGEYTDSLDLISQYPVAGVGFTGTPSINLYTDVASMYLIMANQIGLVGVLIFLITMLGIFLYALSAWRYARNNPDLEAIHLGLHAAVFAFMVNSVADMYFFRLDFQPSITLIWLTIGLAISASHQALNQVLPNRNASSIMNTLDHL